MDYFWSGFEKRSSLLGALVSDDKGSAFSQAAKKIGDAADRVSSVASAYKLPSGLVIGSLLATYMGSKIVSAARDLEEYKHLKRVNGGEGG